MHVSTKETFKKDRVGVVGSTQKRSSSTISCISRASDCAMLTSQKAFEQRSAGALLPHPFPVSDCAPRTITPISIYSFWGYTCV